MHGSGLNLKPKFEPLPSASVTILCSIYYWWPSFYKNSMTSTPTIQLCSVSVPHSICFHVSKGKNRQWDNLRIFVYYPSVLFPSLFQKELYPENLSQDLHSHVWVHLFLIASIHKQAATEMTLNVSKLWCSTYASFRNVLLTFLRCSPCRQATWYSVYR